MVSQNWIEAACETAKDPSWAVLLRPRPLVGEKVSIIQNHLRTRQRSQVGLGRKSSLSIGAARSSTASRGRRSRRNGGAPDAKTQRTAIYDYESQHSPWLEP